MKKTTNFFSLLAVVAFILLQTSRADIIFSDNFNITDGGGDINYQIGAEGRQSGSITPLDYVHWFSTNIVYTLVTNAGPTAGKLEYYAGDVLGDPYGTFSPNHNFTESGDFSIEYEIERISDVANWSSLEFGKDSPNASP